MDGIIVFVAKYFYLLSIAIFVGYFFVAEKKKEFLIFSLFALPASYLLGLLASHLFYDPRPFVVSHSIPLFPHTADNGFPSDHALLTGALAAIVTVFSIPVGIMLWLLAFLIGVARVLAHVHHTLDIAGSFAIAALSTLAVWLVRRGASDKTRSVI
ncbi:MAG: phosphatase PAP2 family protein [Minisyncoccota bacterium]